LSFAIASFLGFILACSVCCYRRKKANKAIKPQSEKKLPPEIKIPEINQDKEKTPLKHSSKSTKSTLPSIPSSRI
jgi:hypothetical protein